MKIPTHINNMFNLKVNTLFSNATMNMGNAIHKGHSANVQFIGRQAIIGDLSPSGMINGNAVADPDLIDEAQVQV